MWFLLAAVAQAEPAPPGDAPGACAAHVEWGGRSVYEVVVRGGLAFGARSFERSGEGSTPLVAISNDGLSAHRVVYRLDGQLDGTAKPTATLDPETFELRNHRGRTVGSVDLERGTAEFGRHRVVLDGSCTAAEAMLAVLGARQLHAGEPKDPVLQATQMQRAAP